METDQGGGTASSRLTGALFQPVSAGMSSSYLNACVGNNTGSDDNSQSYSEGFQSSTEALLKAAGVETPPSARQGWGDFPPIDILVYPICYGARHYVELTLKRMVQRIWELYELRWPNNSKNLTPPQEVDLSHSVYRAWQKLHTICQATDGRLATQSAALEPFICDIDHVDDTGQAFRYPSNARTSELHLSRISVINLAHFAEGFAKMTQMLEELEYTIADVHHEVATRTYTAVLNRQQLVQIAMRLPHCAQWGTEEFNEVKKALMSEYTLSGTQFSRALVVIRGTHSIAHRVGFTLPLPGVSKDMFQRLHALEQKTAEFGSALTKQECAAVLALTEIGLGRIYPEMFEPQATSCLTDDGAFRYFDVSAQLDLARRATARPDIIESALIRLGQEQLAAEFADVYAQQLKTWKVVMENQKEINLAALLGGRTPAEDEAGNPAIDE